MIKSTIIAQEQNEATGRQRQTPPTSEPIITTAASHYQRTLQKMHFRPFKALFLASSASHSVCVGVCLECIATVFYDSSVALWPFSLLGRSMINSVQMF